MNSKVICINSKAHPLDEGCALIYFDGIAFAEDAIVVSPYGEGSSDKIKDSEGEWILIERDRQGISVYTDIYGYYTVFYSVVNVGGVDFVYLGNVFSSVCAAVNRFEKYEINASYCMPMLASYSPFFNTSHSSATTRSGVYKLSPLKKIKVGRGKIVVEDDDRFLKYSNFSYEELLLKGVESIARRYKSFLDNDYKPVFYLSGGKDSRACLSACDPNLHDGYFFSQNPNDFTRASRKIVKDDYDIAASIADKVGLKRFHQEGALNEVVGYDAHYLSLSKKISNKSNVYNPSMFINAQQDFNGVVEVRGGGGEVLRSYWTPYFEKMGIASNFIGKNGYGTWKDFTFLFNKLVSRKLFEDDSLYKSSQKVFVDEMLAMNKSTAREALEEHYFLHRNRYHFGHHRASYLAGKACYMPLSNRFLYLASKKLSFLERKHGKLLYDIINNSKYDLDSIEYESGGWDWESEGSGGARAKASKRYVDSSFYSSMQKQSEKLAPALGRQEFLRIKFEEFAEIMREDDVFSFVGEGMYGFLKDKVLSGSSSSSQVVQKMFSMIDATSEFQADVVYIR